MLILHKALVLTLRIIRKTYINLKIVTKMLYQKLAALMSEYNKIVTTTQKTKREQLKRKLNIKLTNLTNTAISSINNNGKHNCKSTLKIT